MKTIREKANKNLAQAQELATSDRIPMGYHRALTEIKQALSDIDVVYVSEGANTMDISRSIFDVQAPRLRIDAGTFATMGVGMGYAIAGPPLFSSRISFLAAQLTYPTKRVVAVVGDSAFGFRLFTTVDLTDIQCYGNRDRRSDAFASTDLCHKQQRHIFRARYCYV